MRRLRSTFAAALLQALLAGAAPAAQPPDAFVREPDAQQQAAVRAEFGPGFRVLETDHFRVVSDTSPRYQRVVAGLLEQFHQEVRRRYFEREMAPIPVYLFDAKADVDRFLAKRGQQPIDYARYDQTARALYARRDSPTGTESGIGQLFHEMVHAMIDAEFEGGVRAPTWFHEGFASLFESGRVLRGELVYGNPSPPREAAFRVAFEAGKVPSLAELFAASDTVLRGEPERRQVHFNAARSLLLSLLLNPGEPALREFIRRLRAGSGAAKALAQATGLSPEWIESAWHRSIREVNYGGDYLLRGSRTDDLEILIEGAGKYPRYGDLRMTLAWAQLSRGNEEAAIRNARAALQDPRFVHPPLALLTLAMAIADTDAGEATRALDEAVSYQPWNPFVMKREFEMLAGLYEKAGDAARAAALRAELARLQALDRTAP